MVRLSNEEVETGEKVHTLPVPIRLLNLGLPVFSPHSLTSLAFNPKQELQAVHAVQLFI